MKKSRFTEEQIAFALRQAETGTKATEVYRKMGMSEATLDYGAEFISKALDKWAYENKVMLD